MQKDNGKIKIIKSPGAMLAFSKKMLAQEKTIGLVPTMGALHSGHISLVEMSAKNNDITIVSIFVNPTQFGANEDFSKYPRRLQKDASLCEKAGATIIFAPLAKDMYPKTPQTFVRNTVLENMYCGAYRKGHFSGVLSVVAKLFNITQPHNAYFGKKDFQQLHLIKEMVSELNFPIKITGAKIIREKSGLAMSSRNEYMSAKEKEAASSIYAAMKEAKKLSNQSIFNTIAKLKEFIQKKIEKAGGKVQYIEITNKNNLMPLKTLTELKTNAAIILIACYFGKTRLIDNLEL